MAKGMLVGVREWAVRSNDVLHLGKHGQVFDMY